MSNAFWEYSLDRYAHPGVARCCLALQDEAGADVNLLLYAAFMAGRGEALTCAHLDDVTAAIADWRKRVVLPLRTIRKSLRNVAGAEGLREEVKALELDAERQQQDLMWTCYCAADLRGGDHCSLADNLRCALPGPLHNNANEAFESLLRGLA